MGILTRLLQPEPQTERRASINTLIDLGFGYSSRSGVKVTQENALSLTALWACVRVVAESVAGLPLFVYQRRPGGGKDRAGSHPVYRLLHDQPNPEMTAFELRELLAAHVESWGNGYCSIDWSDSGQARALWPLNPAGVEGVERRNGVLWYGYRLPSNEVRWLRSENVLHIRGMGGDGIFGYSPVRVHMESIGLGLATERFGSAFFGNGARPGGLLSHPGRLSEEAQKRLLASFAAGNEGLENAHRLKILEEGMSYTAVGIPPDEAQFLQTRQFQVSEIARIFRIPPHMIQDLDRATFSNVEQQSIDFVVHSLRPRLVRFEQAFQRQLLTPGERSRYFVEHLVDGLLRGDIASRYAAYNTAIQAGFMSRNEVRALENLNPAEDLDAYLVPLNMIEAGAPIPESAPAGRAQPTEVEERQAETRARSIAADRRSIATAQEGVLLDSMSRIVRREVNDIGRAIDKYLVKARDVAGFLLWLDEFYQEHADFTRRNLLSGFTALAALVVASVNRELGSSIDTSALADFVADFVEAMANRWADGNGQQLRALVRENEGDAQIEALQERLAGWDETEAGKNARREVFRGVSAFGYATYGVARVSTLRWVAGGENCPYCKALNGRIVGYDQSFVDAGDFQPAGATAPLALRRNYKHAPLHDGCDCQVIAG